MFWTRISSMTQPHSAPCLMNAPPLELFGGDGAKFKSCEPTNIYIYIYVYIYICIVRFLDTRFPPMPICTVARTLIEHDRNSFLWMVHGDVELKVCLEMMWPEAIGLAGHSEWPGWSYISKIPGWWQCNNHLEKYEFVNGKDYPIYIMENKIHVWNHQPDSRTINPPRQVLKLHFRQRRYNSCLPFLQLLLHHSSGISHMMIFTGHSSPEIVQSW